MEKKEYPKVLVVSTNAWRDNTGINTLIEFFKCWDADKLAQVYTKSTLPNTSVCNTFFSISENAVMKSVLKRGTKTGKQVFNTEGDSDLVDQSAVNEQKMYSTYHGKLRVFLSYCREIVWKFGRWKTAELDKFVDDFNPDVLYIPIYPTIYMGRIQKYIIERTKKPIVSYIADDNYSYEAAGKGFFAKVHRFYLRKYVKYIIEHSAKLMVISPKQKEESDRLFGVDSVVMTKGIDFDPFEPYEVNKPIKMVYTGKLIIGRWKSLAAIAEALGKINANEIRMELDIYTTDVLTEEQKQQLNRNGCSVRGSLTLQQVKEVQKKADILVFAESLEEQFKHTARLSFSTKITDYLKSGKCIFAIGDKEIAPIDYFQRYDSAVTATTYDEIYMMMEHLVKNQNVINQYAEKAHCCGVLNHSREKMDELLKNTLNAVCR